MNPAFSEWACSFSGCDGGDPSSPIWVSGIEWGFGKEAGESEEEYEQRLNQYYTEGLPDEIQAGAAIPADEYGWAEHNQYTFGRSVAKLYLALIGLPVTDYYQIDSLPGKHSIFKLNLYPIAFRNDGDWLWDKYNIAAITGMESKETYRTWCFLNRFPAMSELVRQHCPAIVIGLGVSYLVDFFACFAGTKGTGNIHVESYPPGKNGKGAARRLYWSHINDGKTLLAVVPFFTGSYGLNSNYLLQTFGGRIAEIGLLPTKSRAD